jgi:anaerobic magnesium-protoporphyrin IX monomethyl ester cyclase
VGNSKVQLINPPFIRYGGVEGHGGKNTPLNLAYIASFTREEMRDVDIDIIDAEGLELTYEQIYERVDAFSPDIIGITCPTPVYYIVQQICSDLKRKDKDVKIVIGGPHVTALPKESLTETECDVVVIGEGELTFLDIVSRLKDGKDLHSVPGIAYKENGDVYVNKRRELINDLDILPFPAKDLLPLSRYYLPPTKRIKSERATNMITSRGCPFSCNFCMAKTIWTSKTRLRSVKNVIEEIKLNVDVYRLTEFSFHDELFTFRRDRVIELCQSILKEGIDITWVCQARAGSVDLEMLTLMKRAGCGKIAFGFESGSDRMLKLMNKKETIENAVESVSLCKKAGIGVEGAFILGYPGEDLKSINDSIKFALELDCETVAWFIAIPYPGTRLYYEAIEKGYLKERINWMEFAPVSNLESPMIIPNFTPEELMKWKKRAYRKYYLRPKYVFMKLVKIRSSADLKDIIRGLRIFKAVTK